MDVWCLFLFIEYNTHAEHCPQNDHKFRVLSVWICHKLADFGFKKKWGIFLVASALVIFSISTGRRNGMAL